MCLCGCCARGGGRDDNRSADSWRWASIHLSCPAHRSMSQPRLDIALDTWEKRCRRTQWNIFCEMSPTMSSFCETTSSVWLRAVYIRIYIIFLELSPFCNSRLSINRKYFRRWNWSYNYYNISDAMQPGRRECCAACIPMCREGWFLEPRKVYQSFSIPFKTNWWCMNCTYMAVYLDAWNFACTIESITCTQVQRNKLIGKLFCQFLKYNENISLQIFCCTGLLLCFLIGW